GTARRAGDQGNTSGRAPGAGEDQARRVVLVMTRFTTIVIRPWPVGCFVKGHRLLAAIVLTGCSVIPLVSVRAPADRPAALIDREGPDGSHVLAVRSRVSGHPIIPTGGH